MLNSYYTEKLLGMQGVEIKNITENVELSMIGDTFSRNTCQGGD